MKPITRAEAVPIHSYPPELRQGWHRHSDAIVCLILGGNARECVRGHSEVAVGPLSVGVKPIGFPHTDHFGPYGLRAVRIGYDAESLAALGVFAVPLTRWGWTADWRIVATILRGLACSSGNDVQHEVLAALSANSNRSSACPPSWLVRSREVLDDCYRDDVRLSTLATLNCVHPVYMARAFRSHYGCSVGEYIRRRRVQAAVADLVGSNRSIASIAFGAGFSDQAHLTRQMRQELGTTPAALRRALHVLQVRHVQEITRIPE